MVTTMDIYDRAGKMISQAMDRLGVKSVEALGKEIGVNASTLKNWKNRVSSPLSAKAVNLKRLADAAGEEYGNFYRYLDSGECAPKNNALVDPRLTRAYELLGEYLGQERASMNNFIDLVQQWMNESTSSPDAIADEIGIDRRLMNAILEGRDPGLDYTIVARLITAFNKELEFKASDFCPTPDLLDGSMAPNLTDPPKFPQRNGHGKA